MATFITRDQGYLDDIHISEKDNWFDMALVKALLYNEDLLNRKTSFSEHLEFIRNDFNNIILLFNKDNYSFTKEKLKILENRRIRQMFPEINSFK